MACYLHIWWFLLYSEWPYILPLRFWEGCVYVCVQGRFKFLCVLGGSGTIIHVSADDSIFFFFLQWWLWRESHCVFWCVLTEWLLCPQLSRLKQELAQMRQELQYKEMGMETLQEWVKLSWTLPHTQSMCSLQIRMKLVAIVMTSITIRPTIAHT